MAEGKKGFFISFNSPVILVFSLISLGALLLGYATDFSSTTTIFSVYRSDFSDPLTYVRFFGHVFGHADFEHFMGNIMLILVLGPMLEEKYGSKSIFFLILSTAVITGLLNFIIFPNTMLLGASGVVFALIMLSSFASFKEGKIPITFILVALIYIGQEIYSGIYIEDNISNLTHIAGGIIGCVFGFKKNKK